MDRSFPKDRRAFSAALLLAAVLLLCSCAKPLPPDKAAYAGEWSGPGMSLTITAGGSVSYVRREGTSRVRINAPVKEFQGDNFIVGLGPAVTTFVVTAPPRQEAGVWRMTVDGVELTRAR